MIVALERGKIAEKQLEVRAATDASLREQLDILKETNRLKQEQIDVYKNMMDMQAKMAEAKDRAYQDAIKQATPSFFDNAKLFLGGMGAGGILFGALLIFL